MLLRLCKCRWIIQPNEVAVHTCSRIAVRTQRPEDFFMLALTPADHRGKDLKASPALVLQQNIDDLLRTLCLNFLVTHRAVLRTRTGEEQTQVVVDLGNHTDGRTRIAIRGLLINGDGWRQAFDKIDIGLVHLVITARMDSDST